MNFVSTSMLVRGFKKSEFANNRSSINTRLQCTKEWPNGTSLATCDQQLII
jgi:hypothetical protein